MVALSKPTLLDYTCYELGHTWTPSCKKASLDVAILVAKQALKVYGSLYFVAGLVRKRGKDYFTNKMWKEILQSTAFLTINGTLFITCFCIWRKLTGFYFYLSAIVCGIPASAFSLSIERKERKLVGSFYYVNSVAFIPSLVASFIAILQERKSRRGLLAVYMGNIAVETVWRMLEARGWVKSLPNGEVLLFSIASAVYLYYFKKSKGLPEGTVAVFSQLFGADEILPTAAADNTSDDVINKVKGQGDINGSCHDNDGCYGDSVLCNHGNLPHQRVITWLQHTPSHLTCRHRHGCVFYVINGCLRMFGIGYCAQAALKLLGAWQKVLTNPQTVLQILGHRDNFKLGAFTGTMVAVFRGMNCILRWLRDKDDSLHGMVAGFVAGWSMMFYKSSTIALYTTSKALEMLYFMGIAKGHVPYIRHADVIIYTLSTGFIFHAAAIEAHNIRPSYRRFLLQLGGNAKLLGSDEILQSPEEILPKDADDNTSTSNLESTDPSNNNHGNQSRCNHGNLPHQRVITWLQHTPSHMTCRHKHGCVFYVVKGFIRMFGVGYAIQAAIKMIGALGKLFKQPKSVIHALVNSSNVKLGAFLGSFVGLYKGMNCILRWLRNKDDSLHGMVAGFVAGWSMMFYKSQTIALYTASKLVEILTFAQFCKEMLYFKGIRDGLVPYIKCGDIIIYSVSTALVFHAAVLEPHNLRPAYWNFLLKVTGNKFAGMNRRLLDPWVPNCSKLYPDMWPNYDMRYTKLVKPS